MINPRKSGYEVYDVDNDDDEATYMDKMKTFNSFFFTIIKLAGQKVEEDYSNYLKNYNCCHPATIAGHSALYQNNNPTKALQFSINDFSDCLSMYMGFMKSIKYVFQKNGYADKKTIIDGMNNCYDALVNVDKNLADTNSAAKKINDKVPAYKDSQIERFMSQQEHDLDNVIRDFAYSNVFEGPRP